MSLPTAASSTAWSPSANDAACMALLSFVSLLAALDSTVMVTILPIIAHELKGSAADSFWIGTSYLLTSAVSQPFIATLADSFSLHRKLLWLSVGTFTVASIICALSRTFTPLLAGRFIQGIGGGGILTLVQIIFARLVPLRERPRWFSIVLAAWAIGTVGGPFVGSILATKTSFHWIFWLNLPLCGLALVLIPFVVPSFPAMAPCSWSQVDWVGAVVILSSTTSILLGLSWGGVTFPWTSKWTLLALGLGIFGILLFNIWEHNFAKVPFIRASMFGSHALVAAYFCAFLQGLILLCLLYYIPFYFASAQQRTPMQSSVCLLPLSSSLLPGAVVASQVISRIGRYRWALWLGWVLTALGSGLLRLLGAETTPAIWILVLLVLGVGNGSLLSAINFSIQSIIDPVNSSLAASMYTFGRSLGMAVGVAIGGNVFQNVMAGSLLKSGLSTAIAKDAEGFVYRLDLLDDSALHKILNAYVDGFQGVFYVLLGVSILGLVVNIFMQRYGRGQTVGPA